MKHHLLVALFCTALIAFTPARAATSPLDWATIESGTEVSAALSYFEDPTHHITLADIVGESSDAPFQRLQGPQQFSRSRSSYWFRVAVTNTGTELAEKLIVLKYPSHHQILFAETVLEPDGWQVLRQLRRDARSMINEVDIQHRMPVYVVEVLPGQTKTLFFQIASPTIRINVEVWDAMEFLDDGRTTEWWFLVFLGVILAATLYSAVIAVASRSALYGTLFLITIMMLFAQVTQHGHAYQILGGTGGLFNYAWLLQQCWTSAAVLLFSYIFLGGAGLDRISRYSIIVMALGFTGAGLYSLFDYQGALLPARPLLALGPIALFAIVIYQVRLKNKDAVLFLLAWTPLLFLTILVGLGGFGLLDVSSLGSSLVSAWIPTTVLVFVFSVIFRTRNEYQESMGKSTFLAVLSHEVRTPLTGIIGTVSLLGQSPLNARQKSLVSNLKESSNALLTLLDDVLQMSRFEAGKPVDLELSPTNLVVLIETLVGLMSARAEAKGLQIEYQCTGPVPDAVLIDQARLRQVLLNLLSNAVKFADQGLITLTLAVEDRGDGKIALTFSVIDEGIGVSSEAKARLFQPYTQADGDRQQGTGLGLFISQQLVRLMGGEISVQSEVGAGASFCFTIQADVTDVPVTEPAESQERLDGGGKQILLVDDVALNRDVIGEQLENIGFRVERAEDGISALSLLAAREFDVMIFDAFMPGISGLDLARQFREGGGTTPILGLTAAAEPDLIQNCLVSGMNRVLRKPAPIHLLGKTLLELIDEFGTDRELSTLNPKVMQDLGRMVGKERCQQLKHAAEKSLEASTQRLHELMTSGDKEPIAQLVHQLAGISANIGLEKLSDAAEALAVKARSAESHFSRREVEQVLVLISEGLDALRQDAG